MKIQLSACIHQENPKILEAWMIGMAELDVPKGCKLHHVYIIHNPVGFEEELFKKHLPKAEVIGMKIDVAGAKPNEETHQWNPRLVEVVTQGKNRLLAMAREGKMDALLLNDSDQVLQPPTLDQLLSRQKDIIGEILWTRWKPKEPLRPNAWDFDNYGFFQGTMQRWKTPGFYPAGFVAGCLLIRAKVFNLGIDYTRIPNLSFWGEDRHFCIRAVACGFTIWIDTHYPALHLYRKEDLKRLAAWRKKVTREGR